MREHKRLQETIAGFVIMLLILVPLLPSWVLNQAFGEGRLARMFFIERDPMEQR
ncbi:MAG: hypothetical protein WA864_31600 [Acetobacteraceae bacterium]|jgi:hypothetical protein